MIMLVIGGTWIESVVWLSEEANEGVGALCVYRVGEGGWKGDGHSTCNESVNML